MRVIEIVFDASDILFASNREGRPVMLKIDGIEYLLLPGMAKIHTQSTSKPPEMGVTDETLSPRFGNFFYEILITIGNDPSSMRAAI